MVIALGLHAGHDSSCALVIDGVLVSAIQAERLSRKKHHAILSLSNSLPVQAVLEAGGVKIKDVDVIVSSFQWVGPGGFGLHQPLIDSDFSLFDPWDERHRVLSHHLAHAHSTYEASPFQDAAVLICDYAGSPSLDGLDYATTFRAWYEDLTQQVAVASPKVECLSIYRAETPGGYRLLERQFNVAHPGQGSFIYSIAGLYENVSRYIFGRRSAHGALMALAAFGARFVNADFDPGPLVRQVGSEENVFRNDWQHALPAEPDFSLKCCLAWRCQEAAEIALLAAGRRAIRLAESRNLAVAGGVFLNILANSRLSASGICSAFSVPSAPHDAGISVGCAFHGSKLLRGISHPQPTDRLGRKYSPDAATEAIRQRRAFVCGRPFQKNEVIRELGEGKIIARWNGRAEFGPRALGGRSLLASPLDGTVKDRLNRIKDREPWRPVAPVVPKDDLSTFFYGPDDSYWMTMSHVIREEHRSKLAALTHPDDSTRAQALLAEHDEELFSWLKALGDACGYPILVNTSLNRQGEPIIETASEAIEMFLDKGEIDWLILDDFLVERVNPLESLAETLLEISSDTILSQHFMDSRPIMAASISNRTWRLSEPMHGMLAMLGREPRHLGEIVLRMRDDPADLAQLKSFLIHGILVPSEKIRK
jgi:carbamoyltransferase